MSGHSFQEFSVHPRRAADDVAAVEIPVAAVHICGRAAGLLHQQRTRGDIPGRKLELEKTVEEAAGGVGEVEGRCPGPADGLAPQEDIAEYCEVDIEEAMGAERKAGREERPGEAGSVADPALAAVPPGPASAGGGEYVTFRCGINLSDLCCQWFS